MVATRFARRAALAIASGLMVATRFTRRAALAIATGLMVATRFARAGRVGDRHWADGGDSLRPAQPRSRLPLG